MLVSTIVLIVLRLFSVQYLLNGLSMLAIGLAELSDTPGPTLPTGRRHSRLTPA